MKFAMVKSKSRLAVKLFIIVWIVLAVHIVLKLTFNYWQPYVIPNETLSAISDFIDNNRWIEIILNGLLYVFNAILMVLCSIKCWWFKNKKTTIISISVIIACFICNILFNAYNITPIITTILLPLFINKKMWFYTFLTFLLSNIFMILSLFLEGFVNTDDMQYICKVFLQVDYYIMLVLNYFVFNLIRKENK
jgi:hypothetical protein